jgi:hypothetical protein
MLATLGVPLLLHESPQLGAFELVLGWNCGTKGQKLSCPSFHAKPVQINVFVRDKTK